MLASIKVVSNDNELFTDLMKMSIEIVAVQFPSVP